MSLPPAIRMNVPVRMTHFAYWNVPCQHELRKEYGTLALIGMTHDPQGSGSDLSMPLARRFSQRPVDVECRQVDCKRVKMARRRVRHWSKSHCEMSAHPLVDNTSIDGVFPQSRASRMLAWFVTHQAGSSVSNNAQHTGPAVKLEHCGCCRNLPAGKTSCFSGPDCRTDAWHFCTILFGTVLSASLRLCLYLAVAKAPWSNPGFYTEPRIVGTTRWMFALTAICCCWSQKLRLNSLPGPSHSHRNRRSSLTAVATRQASQGCRPVAPRGPASPLSESSKGWPRCEAWLSRPSGRKWSCLRPSRLALQPPGQVLRLQAPNLYAGTWKVSQWMQKTRVLLSARTPVAIHTHTHIYIYMCVCVCTYIYIHTYMCVYVTSHYMSFFSLNPLLRIATAQQSDF